MGKTKMLSKPRPSCESGKPITYKAEDRRRIAARYKVGERIPVEIGTRADYDAPVVTKVYYCPVAAKYPFVLRYIDPFGQSRCIDYFDLDKMSRRLQEEEKGDVQ